VIFHSYVKLPEGRSDRPVWDVTSTLKRAAKDWLPADVVPTSGLVEGTAVLATQSLSDELLKALPKAVPWRNNKEGGRKLRIWEHKMGGMFPKISKKWESQVHQGKMRISMYFLLLPQGVGGCLDSLSRLPTLWFHALLVFAAYQMRMWATNVEIIPTIVVEFTNKSGI